jgi:hypothetical protein
VSQAGRPVAQAGIDHAGLFGRRRPRRAMASAAPQAGSPTNRAAQQRGGHARITVAPGQPRRLVRVLLLDPGRKACRRLLGQQPAHVPSSGAGPGRRHPGARPAQGDHARHAGPGRGCGRAG